MKKTKEGKGITLIALVVTIVVLIILATVSINAVFSENGIIKKAELAKEVYANSIVEDEESMNTLLEEYANAMSSNSTSEKKIIGFTIDGNSFQAEEGMTWEEWVNSSYSESDYGIFYVSSSLILVNRNTSDPYQILNVTPTDLIVSNSQYQIKVHLGGAN